MTALTTAGDLVPFKGALVRRDERVSRVRPVHIDSMDDALRYSKVIAASGLLPKSFQDVGDPTAAAFVAIQLGAEVGLSPMASVQNIAVINGKPGLYGPAMLAVVESSGLMEVFEEWLEGEGETLVAFCKVKRNGRPERVVSFSWGDAKKANLTGKRGPWTEYPKRMMQARARTFALRDTFPDVLLGLAYSIDELQDIEADPQRRPAIVHAPDPEPMKAPAEPIATRTEDVKAAKAPIKVKVPGGWEPVQFSQDAGLDAALEEVLRFLGDCINEGGAEAVEMNSALLNRVVQRMPDRAEEVARLRAAAAEKLAEVPDAEPEPDEDVFPGDLPSRAED